MTTATVKPEIVTEDHLVYLDQLRESGETNMFGAVPYLRHVFALDRYEAKDVLMYWMASFDERHPKGAA